MRINDALKKILLEHKDDLIKNNLNYFLDKSRTANFSFEDLLSLSTQLDKKGMFSLNSLLLKAVLSQENINYFRFSKQSPLPQDDIYKVDLSKPIQERISKENSNFFKDGLLFEKYYPLLLNKLRDSLKHEGKYIESNSISSVFSKEFNKSIMNSELENKLFQDKKLVKEELYPSSSPESSYILYFDRDIHKLKKTIDSLKSFDKKRELILLVNHIKDINLLKKEDFIKKIYFL